MMKNKIIICLITILLFSLVAIGMQQNSDSVIYRVLRNNGFSSEETKSIMELPRIYDFDFFNVEIEILDSCLILSSNLDRMALIIVDENCTIKIKNLVGRYEKKK